MDRGSQRETETNEMQRESGRDETDTETHTQDRPTAAAEAVWEVEGGSPACPRPPAAGQPDAPSPCEAAWQEGSWISSHFTG